MEKDAGRAAEHIQSHLHLPEGGNQSHQEQALETAPGGNAVLTG